MKKIIIMFMAISMLLVSCQINAPIDDISVTTPTNNPSGDNENTDSESDTTPTDTDDEDSITPTDGDTTHGNPSGDNENTDSESDVTNNTDVNYFEHEDGETVNSFIYRIKHGSNYSSTTNQINVLGSTGLGIGDVVYHCDYSTNGNKITFTYHKYPNTPNVKVHNVTVDRTTSPKFTVTIELVDNN